MALIYKYVDENKTAVAVNQKGFPIVVDDEKDNEELGLDAIHLYTESATLRNTNQQFKDELTKKKTLLKAFEGVEEDKLPDHIKTLLADHETVKNLAAGDIVKAKDVQAIKDQAQTNAEQRIQEVTNSFTEKITEMEESSLKDEGVIYELMVSDKFTSSDYVKKELNMTPLAAERYFKGNIQIEKDPETGKRATRLFYNDGTPVFSKASAGEPAGFDEGISLLVDKDPDRDKLKRGREVKGNELQPGTFTGLHKTQAGNLSSTGKIAQGLKDAGYNG